MWRVPIGYFVPNSKSANQARMDAVTWLPQGSAPVFWGVEKA
jgi:hypothetical protein